ncbi:MAG TPA: copper resistance protein B [Lysobacter sp.]|nr:copper resistance protein B [Lysobacter sp.]
MTTSAVLATALALSWAPAWAQETDHSMHMPASQPEEPPPAEPGDPHAGHDMPEVEPDPHAGHDMPPVEADPHAGHEMPPVAADPHAGHDMPPAATEAPIDHAAMGHDMADADLPASAAPLEPIPEVTAADRAAAFPDVAGHTVHDNAVHSFWLLDRLEAWDADEGGTGVGWEALAWVGTDLNRLWLRSEGEHVDDALEAGDIEVLYGRAIAPWWDLVAGVRHDLGEGPSQTFAAIGVMGLAPYKFEVEATAYVGQSGQTAARLEAEYETLFTNRLILQWLAEAEFHGKDDPRRGIGSGLGTVELGARLRYEIRREFAPYVGVVWERGYGNTADFRRVELEDVEDTRVVAGVRIWF